MGERMSVLTYRGYTATVEYDAEGQVLYGRVIDLRDVITFQSDTAADVEREFHKSVDEYLAFCAEQGIEPAKPFSGTLYVRTTPEVHRAAVVAAARARKSLNAWLADVVATAARERDGSTHVA